MTFKSSDLILKSYQSKLNSLPPIIESNPNHWHQNRINHSYKSRFRSNHNL